jgi:hypothetical protein
MLGINSIDMHSFLTKLFFGLCVCLSLSSCHYYKVGKSLPNAYGLENEVYARKDILVHTGTEVFLLANPELKDYNKTLTGKAIAPGPYHQFYKKTKKSATLYSKSEGNPGNEVHLYVSQFAIEDSTKQVWVQTEDIKRMAVYENQKDFNLISAILLFILSIVAFFFILVFVSLLLF